MPIRVIDRKQFDAVVRQLVKTRPGSTDAHEILRQLTHLSLDLIFGAERTGELEHEED
jgi:hypothetical protein